jgi:hypothetical protein
VWHQRLGDVAIIRPMIFVDGPINTTLATTDTCDPTKAVTFDALPSASEPPPSPGDAPAGTSPAVRARAA